MNRIIVVIALLAGCQGGRASERGPAYYVAAPAAQQGMPPVDRSLKATGKATLNVPPDLANVNATLMIERAPTSVAAANQLNRKKRALHAEAKKIGISGSQVILSHIRLSQVWSPYDKNRVRRVIGYRATVSARVELRNFDRIAPLLDGAAKAGATDLSVGFSSTKLTDHKHEVYAMALRAARKKSELMA